MSPQELAEINALRVKREKEMREAGFAGWLQSPEVKLLMTLIPAAQPPETLTTLLRSAYDCGANTGAASTAMSFMDVVMRKVGDLPKG